MRRLRLEGAFLRFLDRRSHVEKDYISIQNDFLADFQGQRTGFENCYSSHTIGWSHNLTPWATIRPRN